MRNQFMLVGNVGQKPELKESKGGVSYLSFSVAVNDRVKKKDSEEYETRTEWYNLVVFDKRAAGLSKVLDKGTPVVVTGKLQMKSQEVDGKNHKTVDLVVLEVEVMGSKKSSESED